MEVRIELSDRINLVILPIQNTLSKCPWSSSGTLRPQVVGIGPQKCPIHKMEGGWNLKTATTDYYTYKLEARRILLIRENA